MNNETENSLLDPTFGGNGTVTFEVPTGYFRGISKALNNGLVISIGTTEPYDELVIIVHNEKGIELSSKKLELREYEIIAPAVSNFIVQPDNKVVVCGFNQGINNPPTTIVFFARLNADGTVDTTFGNNGMTIVDIDNQFVVEGTRRRVGMALRRDSTIITSVELTIGASVNYTGALISLDANGNLEDFFGDHGIVYAQANVSFQGLAILNNDKLLVVGAHAQYTGAFVARFNRNGSLDNSFGAEKTGYVIIYGKNAIHIELYSTIQLKNGRYLTSGYALNRSTGFTRPIIAMLDTDGSLSSSFNDGELLELPQEEKLYASGLSEINNKLLIFINNITTNKIIFLRLHENGSTDLEFENNGKYEFFFKPPITTTGFELLPDKKSLVYGSSLERGETSGAIARFLTNT